MKLKLIVLGLMGTLVFQQTVMAQDTTATNGWPTNQLNTSASAPAAEPAPAAATVVVTNVTTVTVDTNAAATVTGSATTAAMAPAPADTNAAAATAAPATPAAVPAEGATNPAVATADSTAAVQSAAPSIPLIEFQDVPLTVAIENLARQAGINYLLDPKIGFGQPDANGQIKAEPTLSIRWENVTAEQALLALLNNYDLQLVEDPRTKIARISIKDPTAPPALVTRVVQLKYASVSNMVLSVQSALTDRRSHVFPDVRTSQLIVCATENEQDAIDLLVVQLDKPTKQVLIETKLVEVSSTPSTSKGVDWTKTVAAQNVSFGNGVLTPSTFNTTIGSVSPSSVGQKIYNTYSGTITGGGATPTTFSGGLATQTQPSTSPGGFSLNTLTGLTPGIGFLNADGLQAVLSFLNSSYDAQIVSTPRVVTLDNEEATISVTRQFPVINVTASTAGVSSGSSQISYSNIGTTLEVTPRITANDYIWLRVVPDVSSFFATVSKVIAGTTYQADEFDARHIETQVMIPDANTLVMGGLIQDNPTATWNQVPVLGNIPVLGWAFKSETLAMDKDNLMIFITPTIVKDDDFQPATDNFLASKPVQMKEPMNPNGFWNKAQYGDWSNPAPVPGEFDKNPVSQ